MAEPRDPDRASFVQLDERLTRLEALVAELTPVAVSLRDLADHSSELAHLLELDGYGRRRRADRARFFGRVAKTIAALAACVVVVESLLQLAGVH